MPRSGPWRRPRSPPRSASNVNEWRGQSLDRERSQQTQMSTLTQDFVRQDVADARHAELEKRIKTLEERVASNLG